MLLQYVAWIVAIDVIGDIRQAPIERTHETVVITLVIPVFPPVHVVAPKSHLRKVGNAKGDRVKSKKHQKD